MYLGLNSGHTARARYRRIPFSKGKPVAITDDIQAAIIQIGKDIVAERIEVQAKFATINATVATLQTQVKAIQDQMAAGVLVPAADLNQVLQALTLIDQNVKTISDPLPTP